MPFRAARDARSGCGAHGLARSSSLDGRPDSATLKDRIRPAPFNRGLMRPRHVALAWAVAGRMAIETARMGQHLAEFSEQRGGPRRRIVDRRKAPDARELVRRGI